MARPTQPRVLMKKGRKLALRARKASGFDYPTQKVGQTKWTGEDGKPVTVYYDPATGADGKTVAENLLAKLEDVLAACDTWFGVRGLGGNAIVCPDFGGAYHYGCDFVNGGDWYLSLSAADTVVGLAVAEITESYMGLQGKGWNCGGSGGEALSRVLAELATGGADGAMGDYTSGPSWDGADWIDRDQGTDMDYPSIGCGVLYLWWLIYKGYEVEAIVRAGESGGVLAGNYRTVTGEDANKAFAAFRVSVAAVGGAGSFSTDNPFDAPLPAYPPGPTPPPPPPPPGPGGGTLTLKGTVDVGGAEFPVSLSGEMPGASGFPNLSPWKVLADLAAIYSDFRKADWVAVAADVEQLLADIGIVLTHDECAGLLKALQERHETSVLTDKGPPPPRNKAGQPAEQPVE